MKSGPEKRYSYRKPMQGHVLVTSKLIGSIEAKATDLSVTGISILISKKLETGRTYEVTFEIMLRGSKRTIALAAEVVFCSYTRSGNFKVGMRFLEIDQGHDSWMSEYIHN